jgi:hypothetical protein
MLEAVRRISVFLVLALAASVAVASEAQFFGPKTYVVDAGKPKVFSESISVDASALCQGKAAFTLVIDNRGVSSAEILLNGAVVLSERDFSQNRTVIERPIRLADQNALSISLKGGKASGVLTVSIRREIESPIAASETYVLNTNRQVFRQANHVPDATGVFTLVLRNGGPTGDARVKSGTVSLDGTVVVTEKEFNSTADLLRKRVSLRAESSLSFDVKGRPGDTFTVVIHRQLPSSACGGITLALTSPDERTVIATRRILVQGTVAGPRDLGVTVNGMVADLDLTRTGTTEDPFFWTATLAAEPGAFTVSATATTIGGEQATVTRDIQFAPAEEWVEIEPIDRSGPAPLATKFRLRTESAEAITLYEVDLDGDGSFEVSSATLPEDLSFTYPTPGPRMIAARVTTATGRTLAGAVTIFVHSFATMNEMLQRQWSGFVSALGSGSVDAALPYLAGDEAKQKYKRGLDLIRPTLSQFAGGITRIEPIWISGRAAHYLLTRNEGTKLRGYHVYFVRDIHGVWRIAQF